MPSTSLGVAKAGNLKLDFMAKSIGIHFLGFENFFRCYRDTKPKKIFSPWLLLSHIIFSQTCSKLRNDSIDDSEVENRLKKKKILLTLH